jgi:hypothetical protein
MMYSDGCGLLESRPQGGNKVRRTTLLMLALMTAVLVAASGAALAKTIVGTDTGQKNVIFSEGGFRDLVNGGRGTDTCYVDPKDRVKGCERKR